MVRIAPELLAKGENSFPSQSARRLGRLGPLGLFGAALLLGSCARPPYARLPVAPPLVAYKSLTSPVGAEPAEVPATSAPPTVTPGSAAHVTKPAFHRDAPSRARRAVGRTERAVLPAAAVAAPHEAVQQATVAPTEPPEKSKRNPRKGLFWRLFWPGLLVVIAVVVVVGLTSAASTTAGGTVALNIAKDFLVVLPIYTAVVAATSLIIRLIFPHDPNRE